MTTANTFTINFNNGGGGTQYPVEFVAKLIEAYIFRLKGARIKIDMTPIVAGDPKETQLFEQAAGYAIPAYESNYKQKTDGTKN